MAHDLSRSCFTHIAVRYSYMSSFPCSCCQTRQKELAMLSSEPKEGTAIVPFAG